jgi:hypothetical protein
VRRQTEVTTCSFPKSLGFRDRDLSCTGNVTRLGPAHCRTKAISGYNSNSMPGQEEVSFTILYSRLLSCSSHIISIISIISMPIES